MYTHKDRSSKDQMKKSSTSMYTHKDRISKGQMKSSTNMYTSLDPARLIRNIPLPSASHKPSHRLRHTHPQPTSPPHPSILNTTPPRQSTHPTMCSQPLFQVGLGVLTSTSSKSRKYQKYTLPVGPWLVPRGAEPLKCAFRVVHRRLLGIQVRRVCRRCRICRCLCPWCPLHKYKRIIGRRPWCPNIVFTRTIWYSSLRLLRHPFLFTRLLLLLSPRNPKSPLLQRQALQHQDHSSTPPVVLKPNTKAPLLQLQAHQRQHHQSSTPPVVLKANQKRLNPNPAPPTPPQPGSKAFVF